MPDTLSFDFALPTTLLFGAGRLAELGTTPHMPKGKSALIVIGKSGNILRRGYLGRVQGLLAAHGIKSVLFDGVLANPRTEDVDAAAEQARRMGAEMVVGIGGGSVIDSAKAIALAATAEAPFWEGWASGAYKGKSPLPIVAIPTTAGTGTEADGVAMICGAPGKRGFRGRALFPSLAVVDPELSASMPPALTAYTGMDAFFHAAECFLSKARQPMIDMLCLEAVHLVTRFLPRAVRNGEDMQARTGMAWASTAGGMALALGCPLTLHVFEYSFSGAGKGSAHGAGLTMLSQAFFGRLIQLARNDAETSDRLLNLVEAMDFQPDPGDERHPFLQALEELVTAAGLGDLRPEKFGFGEEDIAICVSRAMEHQGGRNFRNSPVPMGEDDIRAIFEETFARR